MCGKQNILVDRLEVQGKWLSAMISVLSAGISWLRVSKRFN